MLFRMSVGVVGWRKVIRFLVYFESTANRISSWSGWGQRGLWS